jgi:hypothetical protein
VEVVVVAALDPPVELILLREQLPVVLLVQTHQTPLTILVRVEAVEEWIMEMVQMEDLV